MAYPDVMTLRRYTWSIDAQPLTARLADNTLVHINACALLLNEAMITRALISPL